MLDRRHICFILCVRARKSLCSRIPHAHLRLSKRKSVAGKIYVNKAPVFGWLELFFTFFGEIVCGLSSDSGSFCDQQDGGCFRDWATHFEAGKSQISLLVWISSAGIVWQGIDQILSISCQMTVAKRQIVYCQPKTELEAGYHKNDQIWHENYQIWSFLWQTVLTQS